MRNAQHRILSAVAVLLLLGGSLPTWALGLGEARLESFLNQQLEVTVRLLDASESDLESLTVRPAAPADYERLGLMSDAVALGLETRIDRSVRPPVVRIRSSQPVTDPVVQLLIDARWANGRMLREYTLFLDPPTLDRPAPAPEVTREARPEPAPQPAPRAQPAEPAPERPARVPARPEIGDRYGPVASGETLWRIASEWRPDASLNMNQVMLAILERNPQAFRDGNINRLLRGAELDMPSVDEVAAIDPGWATAEARRQAEAFRPGAADVPVVADVAVDQQEPAPARPEPALAATDAVGEVEHRLELVPPLDDQESAGAAAEAEAEEFSQLQETLARTEEELLATRMEAEELRNRLETLEREFSEEFSGVSLADADLAELEQILRETRLADREDEALAESEQPEAAAEAAAGADSELPVTPIGESRGGWMAAIGNLLTSPLVIGAVALLVLLALAALVVRRMRARSDESDDLELRGATRTNSELAAARDRVRRNPEQLTGHLALLTLLADRDQDEAFSEALENMFGYVGSGNEPAWRDALALAGRQVPDHPLVAGSADSARTGLQDVDTAQSESGDLDEKARDILRILEEDHARNPEGQAGADPGGSEDELPEPDLGAGDEDWLEPASRDGDKSPAGVTQEGNTSLDLDMDLDMGDLARPGDDPAGGGEDDEVESFLRQHEGAPGENESGNKSEDELDESRDEIGDQPDAPEKPAAFDAPDGIDEPEIAPEGEALEADEEADIFSLGEDDAEVKLDLARAYLSMEDPDSARTILEEVLDEGNDQQREQARKLLNEL